MFRLILMSCLSVFLINCGNYTNVKAPFDDKQMGGGTNTSTETDLDFATIKKEILDDSCINCHSGRHKQYENYVVVQASAFAMLARMETSDPARLMPKDGPPLPPEKIAMFKEWVQAGAPQFADKDNQPNKPVPNNEMALSFAYVKEKVLDPYKCTACHVQYNNYKMAYKDRGAIISLVGSDKMPFPKRKNAEVTFVSDQDKKILMDWVGQGAPEFAGEAVDTVEMDPLQPTFISIRDNILGPKCILCHNSYGNRGFGKSFDTFRNLWTWMQSNPNLIKTKKAEGEAPGLFVESMLRDPNDPLEFFSPMPFNTDKDDVERTIPRVTEEEIAIIQEWINLNLPYDQGDL